VAFAEAEVSLAGSLGQGGKSFFLLVDALHMLGRLKEAEQHHRTHLLREDLSTEDRALCLTALALVIRDQGRLSEALETAEQATALATTIPDGGVPEGGDEWSQTLLDKCHQGEASILERMGRLEEAIAKDQLSIPRPTPPGATVRMAISCVGEGMLEAAQDILCTMINRFPTGDYRTPIEGPDLLVRAKELLCKVLHSLRGGGEDWGAEAQEAALRAELRHHEAERVEALREVRTLLRRDFGVGGEGEGEEAGAAAEGELDEAPLVAVAPHKSRKKRNKKGKRERRRRAAAAAQGNEEGKTTGEAAAAAVEGGDSAGVGRAPPVWSQGPAEEANEEEAEAKDDCPVCLQPLGAEGGEEEEGVLITCGHEFHVTCLDAWVSTCVRKRLDVTCPSCRAPVNRGQGV
jgi:tetratricopeptide (TPR) repeat protein